MTHSAPQIIHGSPFALRHDGAGHCPVDNTFSEAWVTLLKMFGDEYLAIRRFPDHQAALDYVATQVRAIRAREVETQGVSV